MDTSLWMSEAIARMPVALDKAQKRHSKKIGQPNKIHQQKVVCSNVAYAGVRLF